MTIVVGMAVVTGQQAAAQSGCGEPIKPSQEGQYNKAVAEYERGHYIKSNEMLKKLLKKNPRSADIYFYLGLCAVQRDYNPGAIRRYFTKLAEICEDYPDARAHFYEGVVKYSDDAYEEAVACFNRYFEIANRETDRAAYTALYAEASNYLHWSQFLAEAYRNQVPFNPIPIIGVSSREDEILPYITLDGKECYYMRNVPVEKPVTFYERTIKETRPMMCVSRWKDTTYSEGDVLQWPFNQGLGEGGITMTADGRKIYCSANHRDGSGYNNIDIYRSELRGGKWTPLEAETAMVNGNRSWESQPSVSADGQYLYFASNRPGGYGGTDIWRCRRLKNGTWGRAENLGPSVNTAGNEKCPFIHADGKTLYFASNGWQGFGGYDLYFININDTYLQRPTNMGLPINGEKDDISLGVTTDGKQGYYAGRRTEGPTIGGIDIYRFDLYPSAQPEAMSHSTGQLKDKEGKAVGGEVTVIRAKSDNGQYEADSIDGSFAVVLSEEEDNLIVANSAGYLPAIVHAPASEVRRGKYRRMMISMTALERHTTVDLDEWVPDTTQVTLPSTLTKVLDILSGYLLDNPLLHATIEGRNGKLAKAIYDYFTMTCKMRPDRLTHQSGGRTRIVIDKPR